MTASAEIGLRESLTKFGIVDDPVWNEFNGVLIAGHQRLKQIDLAEGHTNYLIDVKRVWIEDIRVEKALNIRLNNPNDQGEYDAAKLIDMFANNEVDWDLTGIGIPELDMMGMEQGLSTEYLDGIFSPEGLANVGNVASAIDSLMNQSDELKKKEPRRNTEDLQNGGQDQDIDSEEFEDDIEEYNSEDEDQNRIEPQTDIAGIKERRKLSQNILDSRESDYYVVLTFGNNEQSAAFCQAIGYEPGTKIVDGVRMAKLFNINLPQLKNTAEPKPQDDTEE